MAFRYWVALSEGILILFMRRVWYFVPIAAVLIVAALTNPNLDRHKKAVREMYSTALEKQLGSLGSGDQDSWLKLGSAIGMALGSPLVDQVIDSSITSTSFIFFSTTTVSWQGWTKTIGIGAFDHVFLLFDFPEWKLDDREPASIEKAPEGR